MAPATDASGSLVHRGQRTAKGEQLARADSGSKTRPINGGTPWIRAEGGVFFDENSSTIAVSAIGRRAFYRR